MITEEDGLDTYTLSIIVAVFPGMAAHYDRQTIYIGHQISVDFGISVSDKSRAISIYLTLVRAKLNKPTKVLYFFSFVPRLAPWLKRKALTFSLAAFTFSESKSTLKKFVNDSASSSVNCS